MGCNGCNVFKGCCNTWAEKTTPASIGVSTTIPQESLQSLQSLEALQPFSAQVLQQPLKTLQPLQPINIVHDTRKLSASSPATENINSNGTIMPIITMANSTINNANNNNNNNNISNNNNTNQNLGMEMQNSILNLNKEMEITQGKIQKQFEEVCNKFVQKEKERQTELEQLKKSTGFQ